MSWDFEDLHVVQYYLLPTSPSMQDMTHALSKKDFELAIMHHGKLCL